MAGVSSLAGTAGLLSSRGVLIGIGLAGPGGVEGADPGVPGSLASWVKMGWAIGEGGGRASPWLGLGNVGRLGGTEAGRAGL